MTAPGVATGVFPPIICLTGIDGCGKSTHIRRLTSHLHEKFGFNTAHLHVWEIAENPRYRNHPFISDRAAVHRYLGMLSGGARALFVFHGLLESLELTRGQVLPFARPGQARQKARPDPNPDLVLANGYWYKYAFTEALNGTDLDYLRNVAACFPRPRLTIMLDLDPRIAWGRKPMVTPYECGFQPPDEAAFTGFQDRLRAMLLNHAALEGWRVIQVDRPENEVANDIVQLVENEVSSNGRGPL